MPATQNTVQLTEEVAEFLASSPTLDALLNYRPSQEAQQRAQELLWKLSNGHLSEEEQQELDQFEHVEMLMQLVKAKARLRAMKGLKS